MEAIEMELLSTKELEFVKGGKWVKVGDKWYWFDGLPETEQVIYEYIV